MEVFMKGKLAACCIIGTIMLGGFTLVAEASTLDTEMPSAGIAVALNRYFEVSQNAEANILHYLTPTVMAANEPSIPDSEFYEDFGIARVDSFLSVRTEPKQEAELVGKMFHNSAGTILESTGNWYKIQSGNVTGYVRAEYIVTGSEAEEITMSEGHIVATVTADILNVREEANAESLILALIQKGEKYSLITEKKGWALIAIDNTVEGWISKRYVDIEVDYKKALTLEEEKEKIAREEAARKAAREAEERARIQAQREAEQRKKAEESAKANAAKVNYNSASSQAMREAVVAYALQFVGNPYVYGGNSLTRGTDCSGFTKLVYAHFGYKLNRSSADQALNGTSVPVSLDSLLPGDLLFYRTGGPINHVALYIGNGQIVHASTPRAGIIVANAYYRTPCAARRIIN